MKIIKRVNEVKKNIHTCTFGNMYMYDYTCIHVHVHTCNLNATTICVTQGNKSMIVCKYTCTHVHVVLYTVIHLVDSLTLYVLHSCTGALT